MLFRSAVNSNLNNEISQRQAADLSINNAVSVISAAIVNETSARYAAEAALSSRITSVIGGGAGSVASVDFHNTSATLESHINLVSNTLSVEVANRTSADNAVSAAAQSAINVVSSALSVETVNRISAVNAVSAAAQRSEEHTSELQSH